MHRLVGEARGERPRLENPVGRDPQIQRRGSSRLGEPRHQESKGKEDVAHLPPKQLVESILEKERRIAEIVGRIKALLEKPS